MLLTLNMKYQLIVLGFIEKLSCIEAQDSIAILNLKLTVYSPKSCTLHGRCVVSPTTALTLVFMFNILTVGNIGSP